MHLREKIAYLIEVMGVKHETMARLLGISRQAFSRRLKEGEFTPAEISIIARELNTTREAIEQVDPARVREILLGSAGQQDKIVLSYVVHLTLPAGNDEATEKLMALIRELNGLNL